MHLMRISSTFIWGFPEIGVPPNHPNFNGIFSTKTNQLLGIPHLWKPSYYPIARNWRKIERFRDPQALGSLDFTKAQLLTWWLIPLSKWVITLVINGISGVSPLITGVITHLLSGMNHQALTHSFLHSSFSLLSESSRQMQCAPGPEHHILGLCRLCRLCMDPNSKSRQLQMLLATPGPEHNARNDVRIDAR